MNLIGVASNSMVDETTDQAKRHAYLGIVSVRHYIIFFAFVLMSLTFLLFMKMENLIELIYLGVLLLQRHLLTD